MTGVALSVLMPTSSSLLSPLLVLVRDRPGAALGKQMLLTAGLSVPETSLVRKVGIRSKMARVDFVRCLSAGTPQTPGYSAVVRCQDRPAVAGAGVELVQWEVGLLLVPVQEYLPLFPKAH